MMAWLVTEVPAPAGGTFTGARGGVTAAIVLTVVVRDTRPRSFAGGPGHGGWRRRTLMILKDSDDAISDEIRKFGS